MYLLVTIFYELIVYLDAIEVSTQTAGLILVHHVQFNLKISNYSFFLAKLEKSGILHIDILLTVKESSSFHLATSPSLAVTLM